MFSDTTGLAVVKSAFIGARRRSAVKLSLTTIFAAVFATQLLLRATSRTLDST